MDPPPEDRLERMARRLHEIYLRTRDEDDKAHNKKRDPDDRSRWPWELLPDELKASNYAQAAYAPTIVKKAGYEVVEGQAAEIRFSEREIALMAEMEHGRSSFERLKDGWRYASQKDTKAKRSPYLVSWKKLPPDIAEYDISAVKLFPEVLAVGGYAVHPPKS